MLLRPGADAPWCITCKAMIDTWQNGLAPSLRFIHPAASSGFLLTLALILIVGAYNIRPLCHIIKNSADELFKIRMRRDSIFTERSASDTTIRLFLLLIFVASAGIFTAIGALGVAGLGYTLTVPMVLSYAALAAVYTTGMYIAYLTIGYTFAPAEARRELIRGYTASLILPAAILALPTVAAIFYHRFAFTLAILALCTFLIAKILFIIKGFRIFYDKISDLVYFILYLCTLEIIPLILAYRIALDDLLF